MREYCSNSTSALSSRVAALGEAVECFASPNIQALMRYGRRCVAFFAKVADGDQLRLWSGAHGSDLTALSGQVELAVGCDR